MSPGGIGYNCRVPSLPTLVVRADRDLADFAHRRGTFDRVSVEAPWVEVDTTDGYKPELDDIVRFVNSPQANE
jgi:hypothetical protein